MEQSPSEANSRSADQEILVFYVTRRFINVFTTSQECSLSWARWIHYKISHPISYILPCTPGSSELFLFFIF